MDEVAGMKDDKKLYLVAEGILPGAILKVCQAKEMLLDGRAGTVGEAVEKAGVSRSAFYLYKDRVFPLEPGSRGMEITLHFVLAHRPGVLSRVLTELAVLRGNILTVHQESPDRGRARVSIDMDTIRLAADPAALPGRLGGIDGVISVSFQSNAGPSA